MLTYPQIDPVMFALGPFSIGSFSLGPFAVRWYGAMYFFAFIAAWFLGRYRAGQRKRLGGPFTAQQFDDVLMWGMFGVIIGARLGYVLFYNASYYLAHPLEVFALWHGGMSFHGGLLGVILFQWLAGKRYGSGLFQTMDFIAPLVPAGLLFGRLGNFINGELMGRVTALPWGMVFPGQGESPRHPSQLYEAALEGVVLFILLWAFSSRPRPQKAVSGLFLLGYGSFRFAVEFAREPDAQLGFLFGGFLTMGMLLCLPMIALGCFFLFSAYKHQRVVRGKISPRQSTAKK